MDKLKRPRDKSQDVHQRLGPEEKIDDKGKQDIYPVPIVKCQDRTADIISEEEEGYALNNTQERQLYSNDEVIELLLLITCLHFAS